MAATGVVGLATVDDLLRLGVDPPRIVAAGRNLKKMEGFADQGVTVRQADYQEEPGFAQAFRSLETLILIPTKTPAAPRSVEPAIVLAAATSAGVKRIVFLSIQASTPTSLFSVAVFILFAECATRQFIIYEAAEAQEFANVTADILSPTGTAPESVADTLSRLLKG